MTWANRLKMFVGLLVVLIITAGALLVFNQRQTHATSNSAQIAAQLYDVGTDYAGIITDSFVDEGDEVKEGQRMFAVRSLQLERDIATGAVSPGQESVQQDGTLVISAATTGVVSNIDMDEGSYVSQGAVLATIDAAGSLYAEAEFVLTPRDFSRIDDGAAVTLRLPNGTEFDGAVDDLTVETVDGNAHVTATIASDGLATAEPAPLLKPGTPLDVSVSLHDDGPLAGVHDALSDFARKIGL
ncbi:HlyD family efflux transporter periplasmic adaptor subunit [Demequina sp.]|uniref:HlyD family efflux transporter periplasmic adaptor subunit n=1 Tax=Demequina sp. TaxID=2050685 RepID=UPI003D0E9114